MKRVVAGIGTIALLGGLAACGSGATGTASPAATVTVTAPSSAPAPATASYPSTLTLLQDIGLQPTGYGVSEAYCNLPVYGESDEQIIVIVTPVAPGGPTTGIGLAQGAGQHSSPGYGIVVGPHFMITVEYDTTGGNPPITPQQVAAATGGQVLS